MIAIGGGSALDVAKTLALVSYQDKPLWNFENVGDNFKNADPQKILETIAVPTTAGTGSEVGRASVIIDSDAETKKIIFHPQMLPSMVILDPKLTLTVPAALTAATGMDALAHNLEAFLAPGFYPMADGIALEGMRLIKDNLIAAFNDGSNIEARGKLLVASMMGATAFQKGLGLIHSLSHPVGAIYHKHHGLLNAIFMPYSLQYNRDVIEQRCVILARYLALPQSGFDAVFNWVMSLLKALKLPITLSDIGIDETRAKEIGEKAYADPSTVSNPKALSPGTCEQVFIRAVRGEM